MQFFSLVEMLLKNVICEIAKLLHFRCINSNIKDMQFVAYIGPIIIPHSFLLCILYFTFSICKCKLILEVRCILLQLY
jgi:hypothetical protein